MSEQEFRSWLVDHEKRITRIETQDSEARLRQVNISAIKLTLVSGGTGIVIWLLTVAAARWGWM